MRAIKISGFIITVLLLTVRTQAQISPGDLAEPHAHLEGMSNCTKCHTLGEKVSNEKCLACHKELKLRISQQKGYHSSAEIKGKECVACHSDHHGRTFKIVRFDTQKFNHNVTGYNLQGAHSKQECKACHKAAFINDPAIKKKKFTYLGLRRDCISCHTDYHQNTLSSNCFSCHTFEKFKPASKFDHNKAKFKLVGKHQQAECVKCHKVEIINGKQMQEFTGIQFASCVNCHKDVHENKFGSDCRQCHTEESFHTVKGMKDFNHDKTNFKLEEKHRFVDCKACHKTAYTDPVKHERCADCHKDYHNGQFNSQAKKTDCKDCHTMKGFTGSTFTIEQHNMGLFKLEGAHLATPCFACHKKEEKWSFRNIGLHCRDCHTDIHENIIDPEYYPEGSCKSCHTVDSWRKVSFDHARTKFKLTGAHAERTCRDCHFVMQDDGKELQRFKGMNTDCISCHADIHYKQFEENGSTNCTKCHESDNWKATRFDHNTAAFKLDGAHQKVACAKCHKEVTVDNNKYVLYKIKEYKCESCH